MKASRPIRVLRVITRLNAGGPSRHVVWLAEGLPAWGYESLLAAGRLAPGEDDLAGFARERGVVVRDVPSLRRAVHPASDARAVGAILDIIREFDPDLIHSHHSKAGFVCRVAAQIANRARRRAGRPRIATVHTFHGNMISFNFTGWRRAAFGMVERLLSHRATDAVVVLSPGQHDEIVNRFRFAPAGKVFIVPNALDLDPYAAPPPAEVFREELGLDARDFVVGMVGRIASQKDHDGFLEAARLVAAESAHAKFVIVGGGDGRGRLERMASEIGLADRTYFLGPRTDLPGVYAGLDVVALSSHNEGTPLSLIEAMAAGRPIVSSDVGGVRDLLTREAVGSVTARRFVESPQPRGLLVSRGDSGQFARELLRLDRDPQLRASLGARGRSYAREHHGLPRLLADLSEIYSTVLK